MDINKNQSGGITVNLQRGEAFSLSTQNHRDAAGNLIDFTGFTFLCQVRNAENELIGELEMVSSAPGELHSSNFLETFDWELYDLEFDLFFRDASNRPGWLLRKSAIKITDSTSLEP